MGVVDSEVEMASVPPGILTPTAGSRGLAGEDPNDLGEATLTAWDLLITSTAELDPQAPTRISGRMFGMS